MKVWWTGMISSVVLSAYPLLSSPATVSASCKAAFEALPGIASADCTALFNLSTTGSACPPVCVRLGCTVLMISPLLPPDLVTYVVRVTQWSNDTRFNNFHSHNGEPALSDLSCNT